MEENKEDEIELKDLKIKPPKMQLKTFIIIAVVGLLVCSYLAGYMHGGITQDKVWKEYTLKYQKIIKQDCTCLNIEPDMLEKSLITS